MPRRSRREIETARELAFILYMNGEQNNDIAVRVGVSAQTMSAWVKDGSWKEKRAANTITNPELISKILEEISSMLGESNGTLTSRDADKLVKLASVIEKLGKKNSPVLVIENFMAFGNWLKNNMGTNKELTVDFIKLLNKFQDAYVTSLMN